MDHVTFRLIVDEPADGRWNMAVDEALLESVTEQGAAPVVRLYGFEPPTLSVGRFQKTDGIFDFAAAAAAGVDFVRRPSGGQAVLHAEELTYAFVIGKGHIEPYGKRWVYRFVAPLLMEGLSRLGVEGVQRNAAQKGDPLNPDCFGSTGEYEIDSGGGLKLVGSAQMVTRTAVLQHGSIPIGREGRDIARFLSVEPSADGHSSNIRDETANRLAFSEVRDAFVSAIRDGLSVTVDVLSPHERKAAERLLETKYSTDEWNRKY